jgi:type I restriction enzyme S subunit
MTLIKLVRVGDVADQIRGVTFPKGEASAEPRTGYLPVLRAGNIQDDGLDFGDLVYVPATRVHANQRVRRDDVLIAASSGSLSVVGKAARSISEFDGGFGAFCKVLRPSARIDPSYFAHFFRTPSYRRKVASLAAGANINNLKNEHLDDLVIPLPPMDEQRRIAAILDQADALRTKRRAARALLDDLASAIFTDMFGDLTWSGTLGALAEVQIGPFGSLLHQEDYVSGGVPVLNPMHMRGTELKPDPAFSVSEAKAANLSLYRIRTGDVVLGRRGEMGRAGVAGTEHDGMLCGTGSVILRPKSVDGVFLHAVVTSARMKAHLERSSLGATLPNLNAGIVKSAPAPRAASHLQQEFAHRLRARDRLLARVLQASGEVDRLFTSLQYRAFQGGHPR